MYLLIPSLQSVTGYGIHPGEKFLMLGCHFWMRMLSLAGGGSQVRVEQLMRMMIFSSQILMSTALHRCSKWRMFRMEQGEM